MLFVKFYNTYELETSLSFFTGVIQSIIDCYSKRHVWLVNDEQRWFGYLGLKIALNVFDETSLAKQPLST